MELERKFQFYKRHHDCIKSWFYSICKIIWLLLTEPEDIHGSVLIFIIFIVNFHNRLVIKELEVEIFLIMPDLSSMR